MTEPEPQHGPAPAPADLQPRVDVPGDAHGSRLLVRISAVVAVLLVALLVAQVWLWERQADLAGTVAALPEPPLAINPAEIAGLHTDVEDLRKQVAALKQERAAAPPGQDIAGLRADLQALQQQVAALQQERPSSAPGADIAGLRSEVQALQRRLAALPPDRAAPTSPPVDLGPLEARVAALERRPLPDTASLGDKLNQVAAAAEASEGATEKRVAALEQRLARTEQQAGRLAGVAAQAQRLEQAQTALQNGQPLGDMPGAPPELARFAEARPPTEAALRLAFPGAAEAALRATRPAPENRSLGARIWLRMRSLVTVKQGDKVLVGIPAAEVIAKAEARLEAGDLAGAVAALDALDPAAAAALAGWRSQAEALLAARAALARMARG
jgi:hypothetical protein